MACGPRSHGQRTRVLLAAIACVIAALVPASAKAHHPNMVITSTLDLPTVTGNAPDLRPLLPTTGTLPFWVDLGARPGRVLYRFDTVIWNAGGALDLHCNPCNGAGRRVYQAVWPNGVPTPAPSPTSSPGNQAQVVDLTPSGSDMFYSYATGHNHFHFQEAARYELLLPDGSTRLTDKVGFCMYDTYRDANSGSAHYLGGSGTNWCAPGAPGASFVRMGISRGWGDFYGSVLADQWIDVTGLAPGTYTLRATIDPYQRLIEADRTNDVLDQQRTIPGVVVDGLRVGVPSDGRVELRGTIVGPEVPVRRNGGTSATSAGAHLEYRVVEPPAHGAVTLTGSPGTTATATYVASEGFTGIDSFRVAATDPRGLESAPATITLLVGVEPPVATAPPALAGEARVGAPLTVAEGSWSGTGPLTFAYQWLRCGATGEGCVAIPDATGASYTATAADLGSTLRARVSAAGIAGEAAVDSAPSAAVAPALAASGPSDTPAAAAAGPAPTPLRHVRTAPRRLVGTTGPDVLRGTPRADLLLGRAGDDLIEGSGGADLVFAGAGDDFVRPGSAADVVDLGHGDDRVRSTDGTSDRIVCGPGRDVAIVDAIDDVGASCEVVVRR